MALTLSFHIARTSRDLNAVAGVIGIFGLGIFLTWFSITALRIPLPSEPVDHTAAAATIQVLGTVVLPYVWAAKRMGLSPAHLGLTRRNLGLSMLGGFGVYAVAGTAFILALDSPAISDHPIPTLGLGRQILLGVTMCLVVAGTDIATRGFVLLALVEHSSVGFAILMQNFFWLFGHTYEIEIMTAAYGRVGAIALFVLLGVLGDAVALKTRNVLGLSAGHVVLNILMIAIILARSS
jgi:hypothetical protein